MSNKAANDDRPDEDVRLHVWLDVACLFRTRSEAQRACKGGKVSVNGQSAKPNRIVRPDDQIAITRPLGRTQRVIVRVVESKHVPKAHARLMYEDVTPAPTGDEIEMRRLERVFRATMSPPRAPDKRERRALRRLHGRDD